VLVCVRVIFSKQSVAVPLKRSKTFCVKLTPCCRLCFRIFCRFSDSAYSYSQKHSMMMLYEAYTARSFPRLLRVGSYCSLLYQHLILLRSSVTEQSPTHPEFIRLVKIQLGTDNAFTFTIGRSQHLTRSVSNKR